MKRYLLLGFTLIGALFSYWASSKAISGITSIIIDKILDIPEETESEENTID